MKLKNWRQGASELHRIIGVWSLFFNLMIAITGFYMLYHILLPSFSSAKAVELVKRPIDLKISLEKLLAKTSKELPGFVPYSITIPSNTNSLITITGGVSDLNPLSSAYSSFVSFNQTTGETVKIYNISKQKFTDQLGKAMYPLHFGNYWGIFIKLLYSILGLTPSILAISGFLLWWRQWRKQQTLNNLNNKKLPLIKKEVVSTTKS